MGGGKEEGEEREGVAGHIGAGREGSEELAEGVGMGGKERWGEMGRGRREKG